MFEIIMFEIIIAVQYEFILHLYVQDIHKIIHCRSSVEERLCRALELKSINQSCMYVIIGIYSTTVAKCTCHTRVT